MNRRQFTSALPAAAALATAASGPGWAQSRLPHPLGIDAFDHLSVNVADFDAALAWYQEVLGLKLDLTWTVSALGGKRITYFSLNGTRVLEIVEADANGTGLKPPLTFGQHFGRTGYGHLCFSTNSVDDTITALAKRGVTAFVKADTYALEGTQFERRIAFINDPEGNTIEFGEPLRKKA